MWKVKRMNKPRIVVLAIALVAGGIAAYLASRLCIEAIEVIPNVSTLQLACARLSLPWQDMKFSSVHSKDAGDWVEGSSRRTDRPDWRDDGPAPCVSSRG